MLNYPRLITTTEERLYAPPFLLGKSPITAVKRLLTVAAASAALAILACASAAPSECVKAAEDAGLPENVI